MAKSRTISIRSPVGGIDRSADYQSEPPFTCYDAVDVWPFDAKTGRDRCAVRPGWAALGSPSLDAVNLLGTLALAPDDDTQRRLLAAAGGTLYWWDASTPAWTSIGTGITADRPVMGASYLQKFYVANDGTPKVYNYAAGTITNLTASAGSVPTDCQIVCVWDDRLVFAAPPTNPHLIYMGRQGDPTDWLFAEEDFGSPVSSSDIEGGIIREPITACIPHDRQCLIVSGANSMTVFRGNPMAGGNQTVITHLLGITNKEAWCKTPTGATYMLTRTGLCRMPPGCGDIPTLVSDAIPEELTEIDGLGTIAFLAADPLFRGIHIHLVGPSPSHWFYDSKSRGFWRMTMPDDVISAIHWHPYVQTGDASGTLVATAEYGIVRLDRTVALGGASPASVTLNPIRIGGPLGNQSMVVEARFAFGENTNDTTGVVEMYCGKDGYAATQLPADRKSTATIGSLGGNRGWNPRIGGQSLVVKVKQTDTSKHWSLEDGAILVTPAGKER